MPPPPAPPVAREVFGAALSTVERYAEFLSGAGVERGLIGPREAERLWDRHLLNCAVIDEAIPGGADVVDIGSGAGLPGVVVAITRPDVSVTLLEPLLRRATFLTECVDLLGLANAAVRRARAEEVAMEYSVDVVTARAVAPLDRLVRWALPLLRPGGELLALKGERAAEELDAAAPVLKEFRVRTAEVRRVGHGKVDPLTTIVRVVSGGLPRASAIREEQGSRRTGRRRGGGHERKR